MPPAQSRRTFLPSRITLRASDRPPPLTPAVFEQQAHLKRSTLPRAQTPRESLLPYFYESRCAGLYISADIRSVRPDNHVQHATYPNIPQNQVKIRKLWEYFGSQWSPRLNCPQFQNLRPRTSISFSFFSESAVKVRRLHDLFRRRHQHVLDPPTDDENGAKLILVSRRGASHKTGLFSEQ